MNYYKLSIFYKRDVFFAYDESNYLCSSKLESGDVYVEKMPLKYVVDKLDSYISKYDILPTMGAPLVSKAFKNVIESLSKTDCQFIPSMIISMENNLVDDSFYALNILNTIKCLDSEKSETRPLLKNMPNSPIKITSLYLEKKNLANVHICRMAESKQIIIVDELFVAACKEQAIKGINFIKEGNQQSPEFLYP
jgi:hypothetical protein